MWVHQFPHFRKEENQGQWPKQLARVGRHSLSASWPRPPLPHQICSRLLFEKPHTGPCGAFTQTVPWSTLPLTRHRVTLMSSGLGSHTSFLVSPAQPLLEICQHLDPPHCTHHTCRVTQSTLRVICGSVFSVLEYRLHKCSGLYLFGPLMYPKCLE